MPNFFSKIAKALKPKPLRGGLATTETGKLLRTPNIEKLQRRSKAATDIGEMSGYLKQHHDKPALVAALQRMKMPVTRENLKTANKALSLRAMARTRAQKSPSLGFDTSLEEAFKNATRRKGR